jgi:hypothetical protein
MIGYQLRTYAAAVFLMVSSAELKAWLVSEDPATVETLRLARLLPTATARPRLPR